MNRFGIAILCCALAALPARADGLAPGKPAGVHQAQAEDFTYIYGGVLVFAGLLFAIIGTTGNPAASATAVPTATQ
jgi:hypothetical protein